MPEGARPAAEIRTWMRRVLREHTDLTPPAWAKQAGVAATTIQRALKDDYQFVTSSRTLAKLAGAVGEVPPQIGSSRGVQIVPAYLPVRYRVQAGLWYEMEDFAQIDQFSHPVAPDQRYSNWPQWLELVVGDSANEKIPNGHYAHVVDAIEMGYAPVTGSWVVVERRRDQGAIRERTIKQVEVLSNGDVRLWPRSTNPRWAAPVDLSGGAREGEGMEVEIVGLVIGSYDPDF